MLFTIQVPAMESGKQIVLSCQGRAQLGFAAAAWDFTKMEPVLLPDSAAARSSHSAPAHLPGFVLSMAATC